MAKAAASGIEALARFAQGLREDLTAVTAGLTLPWSNGPVEGQVNRLKLLKRQGYGRADVGLLRQRVLQVA
jgi:transposase